MREAGEKFQIPIRDGAFLELGGLAIAEFESHELRVEEFASIREIPARLLGSRLSTLGWCLSQGSTEFRPTTRLYRIDSKNAGSYP